MSHPRMGNFILKDTNDINDNNDKNTSNKTADVW